MRALLGECSTWSLRAPNAQALEYLKQTGHVNTYTFTKCLTEQAIAEFHNKSFPVAIVRPSIVASPSLPWPQLAFRSFTSLSGLGCPLLVSVL